MSTEFDRIARKLSPDTKRRLLQQGALADQELSVMLRLDRNVGPQERAELERLGCTIESTAGDVVSVRVAASDIVAVGQLGAVDYVEISRPLQEEQAKP